MDDNISVNTPPGSCFHLPDPIFHQVSQRFTTNLITSIINIVTAPLAVIVNVLVVTAIFSTSRLRTPSNLLIACLALSDVLVGLTAQPGYISYRLMENQHRSVPCFVRIVYAAAFYVCFGVSFMTLSAVSYERFVAVRLRVRYNTFFSSSRVLKCTLGIWIVNFSLAVLQWAKINYVARGIHHVVWLICLFATGVTQVAVLIVVRRSRRQVQEHMETVEIVRKQREVKLALSISIIVAVYLILNTPVMFVTFYHQTLGYNLPTYNVYSWAETFAFLNSFSNPLIIFWKNQQVQQRVFDLLKKVVCW
ncbi:trace amine-associated receptor 7e-like [Oculina patagonica]